MYNIISAADRAVCRGFPTTNDPTTAREYKMKKKTVFLFKTPLYRRTLYAMDSRPVITNLRGKK